MEWFSRIKNLSRFAFQLYFYLNSNKGEYESRNDGEKKFKLQISGSNSGKGEEVYFQVLFDVSPHAKDSQWYYVSISDSSTGSRLLPTYPFLYESDGKKMPLQYR